MKNHDILILGAFAVLTGFAALALPWRNHQSQMPVPGPNQVVITNGTGGSAVCQSVTEKGCEIFVCWQGDTVVSVVPLNPCTLHAKVAP